MSKDRESFCLPISVTKKKKVIQKPYVTRNKFLKVIRKSSWSESCHSTEILQFSIHSARRELSFESLVSHLHTKPFLTIGLSNLFLNFETITGNGCSSRETHCKTNEGCFSMHCHHWSLDNPTIDYSALVFLPHLLPTFALFGTWGKLPRVAAAPDFWQGIDGWHLLPAQPLLPRRRKAEFCLSCSKQSA